MVTLAPGVLVVFSQGLINLLCVLTGKSKYVGRVLVSEQTNYVDFWQISPLGENLLAALTQLTYSKMRFRRNTNKHLHTLWKFNYLCSAINAYKSNMAVRFDNGFWHCCPIMAWFKSDSSYHMPITIWVWILIIMYQYPIN